MEIVAIVGIVCLAIVSVIAILRGANLFLRTPKNEYGVSPPDGREE